MKKKQYKYKNLVKLFLISRVPNRVLNFKRPKWERVKDVVLKKQKNYNVFNIVKPRVKLRSIVRIKRYFKNNLELSKKILMMYDYISCVEKKLSSKEKTKRKINKFYKPFFYVHSLLWYLDFFRSAFSSKNSLFNGYIRLNGIKLKKNKLLLKGDVLSLKTKKYLSKNILTKYSNQYLFYSHLEVDYYGQNLIIIKNLSELNENDLKLLTAEYQ